MEFSNAHKRRFICTELENDAIIAQLDNLHVQFYNWLQTSDVERLSKNLSDSLRYEGIENKKSVVRIAIIHMIISKRNSKYI